MLRPTTCLQRRMCGVLSIRVHWKLGRDNMRWRQYSWSSNNLVSSFDFSCNCCWRCPYWILQRQKNYHHIVDYNVLGHYRNSCLLGLNRLTHYFWRISYGRYNSRCLPHANNLKHYLSLCLQKTHSIKRWNLQVLALTIYLLSKNYFLRLMPYFFQSNQILVLKVRRVWQIPSRFLIFRYVLAASNVCFSLQRLLHPCSYNIHWYSRNHYSSMANSTIRYNDRDPPLIYYDHHSWDHWDD